MNKIIKPIKLLLIILSLSFIVVFFFPRETYKDFGEYAWFILILVMFIRPISDIFPKCKIFSFLLKFRREFGILVGVFGLAHGLGSFIDQKILLQNSKTYIELFLDPYVWKYTGNMFWGILAGAVSIPLLLTSNGISVSLLGKHWKTLQRFSYVMFVFVGLHIYFIKKEIGPLIIIGVWLILWIIAFIKNKNKQKNTSPGPKWLCVPCGYIYDENIGDPDGGIAPGTRFEDIPADWRCPVCGVGKSDFILIEGEIEQNKAQIVKIDYLTPDVIQLQIDTKKEFSFLSGQFISFVFNDKVGEFNRSYSVASKVGNIFTFLIKIKPDGRAGKIWPNLKVGDTINFSNISGNFILLDTQNPKIFIATGTGLAPIYNMILNLPENIKKTLYFGVSNLKDLFYIDKLEKIKNLKLNIYLSKEEVEGYNFGRMNFENIDFDKTSEFYICGNPQVVDSARKILSQKGFEKIFSEEFN